MTPASPPAFCGHGLHLPPLADMLEVALVQNAQLHQVIMHSLMLRALPPSKLAPSLGPQAAPLHPTLQVGSSGTDRKAIRPWGETFQIKTRSPGWLSFWKFVHLEPGPPIPSLPPAHHGPPLLPIVGSDPTLSQGPGGGKGVARSGLWSLLKQAGVCCVEDPQWAHPVVPRAERQKRPSVHHHHHYAPPAALQAVPAPGSPGAYSMWPSVVSATTLPPATGFLPAVRHVTGPFGVAPGGVLP
ncbi:hypothetical protein MC885_014225 [Smutsia gigantea]|nr:hypothetical protein MC885_014225 [Smutsia gigantea]